MAMEHSSLTDLLRAIADPIWRKQLEQPFLQGLIAGTLPIDKFLFYIRQDVLFLRQMNRVFGYGAARAGDPKDSAEFARLLLETDQILVDLHGRYEQMLDSDPVVESSIPLAATTYAYSNHLLVCAADSYLALVTSLLPSMWMYDEMGAYLITLPEPAPTHPYYEWLRVHRGDHLSRVTTWLRGILDQQTLSPVEEAHLQDVFMWSSRYEIAFWQMAWNEDLGE